MIVVNVVWNYLLDDFSIESVFLHARALGLINHDVPENRLRYYENQEKKSVKHSMIQNADMKPESGTCNICSAPCSSCMHLNRALTGTKAEEFSDENCRSGEASQLSMEVDDLSSHRKTACGRTKHAVNETSNLLTVNSSHESLSENAETTQTLSEKYHDVKCLEGPDDSASCISRNSNANLVSNSHQSNSDKINISCSSPSASHLGAEGSTSGPSVYISGLCEIPSSKDADMPENLSECCVGNVESLPTKEIVTANFSSEKSLADNDGLVNGITGKVSAKVYPKSETDSDNDVGDVKDKGHKVPVHDGLHKKQGELVKSPVKPEAQSGDESDDSDIEHDVKVCDICGDAGREELLAICSRCSDGAEHTYCMREMLEKVPEGDWLCEECKYAEETEKQGLDVEEKKVHKVSSTAQISGKRPSESEELAKTGKKQALESSKGSPKGSSPKKIFPLSRESSFKNIDKGKLKSDHQASICNHPDGNDIELARSLSAGPRSQTTKSTLLKSNSFNNINSKPRVKLVDEVPQKKKGAGEHTSKNIEMPGRMISKSTSLKSSNLGRSCAAESKVKMVTSKPGTTVDQKGSKLAKESGASERKFFSRVDCPVVCSTMASSAVLTSKSDQKLTPRSETAKPSVTNNNREFKVNQDGRSNSLLKSKNNISQRTSKSGDETQLDGLPQSKEISYQVDKAKDSSGDCVRSSLTNASDSPFCHKCKDYGHATEDCMVDKQEFGLEGSATAPNSSKDETHKDNRLKAAIQAALLRRPKICKRKEVPAQTEEFLKSATDIKSEVTSQDKVFVIDTPKNIVSTEETKVRQEILQNPTFETLSSNDSKQHIFCPADFGSQPRKLESVGLPPGIPAVGDFHNQALAVSRVLPKISVFPEYEYIWQGVFRMHRSGKPPDLCTGIQAHLSTSASPKVLEVVNKILPEVSLNEVSRLSTWPTQFHQGGAREDNIALYFFAKDIESYERHYKGLLDHMIRNDLALKGTFDGVELLIFPSNQLPENSQRWNMLFYLWGVFRGKRMNHSDSAQNICSPSLNALPVQKDFPTAVMTLSETHCSPKRMDEQSIACGKTCSEVLSSTSMDQGHNILSGNFDIKESIFDQARLGSQVNLQRQDSRINTESASKNPTSSEQLGQEMRSPGSPLKDGQHRVPTPPEAMGTHVSSKIVETNSDCDISVRLENSLSSGIPSAGKQEIDAASNTSKNQISERTNSYEDQRRPKRKLIEEDLNINMEATLQEDPTIRGINCEQTNDNKIQHIDVSDAVLKASEDSYQKLPCDKVNGKLEDGVSSSKKLKSSFSDMIGSCSSGGGESFNGSFTALANHPSTFSSVEGTGCKEACLDKVIQEDLGTTERTFFPVGSHQKNDSRWMLNGMPLEGPCEYKGQFQVGIPNLELALGGETKPQPPPAPPLPPHKGMFPFLAGAVDKKHNQEKPPQVVADEQEGDDNVAASLSLSLSFPSSNKESVKPAPKAEDSPDGQNVNTSFLLFGRYTDK
ncbi:hypothetical protein PIB30_033566 [Stylosanthes scabra]|uniref:PHD-type domain-containing protein n=1 Tax=Stylosanthes scabra TaxID=79078 RepID=A0ABU6WCF9_9FABA|nr:hypothetical protein [Stylosanthes scabra]